MNKENKNQSKGIYNDLKVIIVLILLTLGFSLIPPLTETFVRTILGVLMVLFIPGYAFIAALFPKQDDLENLERLALSFGLSIALTILIGFSLTYTPWGIVLNSNLVIFSGFSLLMVLIAFLRRKNLPRTERYEVTFSESFKEFITYFQPDSRKEKILSLTLIIVIMLSITFTAYFFVQKEDEKFTEFYLLNSDGQASDYPTTLSMGATDSVILGIVNHENTPVNYLIRVKVNNIILKPELNFTLQNNETKEIPVNFTASIVGQNKMEFLLYKLPDSNNVYRSLNMWFEVNQ